MDEDMYLLIQGHAHIKPVSPTQIEVYFLNGDGTRKKALSFKPSLDPNEPNSDVLKVMNMNLIIECSRTDFDELKSKGAIEDYLPNYIEIVKSGSEPRMNTTDPPLGRG